MTFIDSFPHLEVFTLPHEFQQILTFPSEFHGIPTESIWLEPQPFWVPIPWKFQQNLMESTGISWNLEPPRMTSIGIHWNPPESAGNDWNPEILTHSNHFQQIPADSSRFQQIPADSGGFPLECNDCSCYYI